MKPDTTRHLSIAIVQNSITDDSITDALVVTERSSKALFP